MSDYPKHLPRMCRWCVARYTDRPLVQLSKGGLIHRKFNEERTVCAFWLENHGGNSTVTPST